MAMSKPRVVMDSAIRVTPRLRALPIELVPLASTDISSDALVDAQALLTRTVTRVDGGLLEGSDIRFVGTASAGTDHIDLNYLGAHGIHFSSAAGCNASAVGDYVLAAIALCGKLEPILSGADVGLVGYGNVGRGLAKRLAALGARVHVYDPWVTQYDSHVQETDLQGVLSCDVVSLHAALHDSQPFPSFGMIGVQEAKVIERDTLFINAGRGGLLSEEAASYLVERGVDLVLDTWPNEPRVSLELLMGVRYATPHIAGYSETAKNNATDFLIPPLIETLELEDHGAVPQSETDRIVLPIGCADNSVLAALLTSVGRIEADDAKFRAVWARDQGPDTFERQRREYTLRQQLEGLLVSGEASSLRLNAWLEALGVTLKH